MDSCLPISSSFVWFFSTHLLSSRLLPICSLQSALDLVQRKKQQLCVMCMAYELRSQFSPVELSSTMFKWKNTCAVHAVTATLFVAFIACLPSMTCKSTKILHKNQLCMVTGFNIVIVMYAQCIHWIHSNPFYHPLYNIALFHNIARKRR